MQQVQEKSNCLPHPSVLDRWLAWRQSKGITTDAYNRTTLRKGDFELVVYEYGPALCAVVKKGLKTSQKLLDFREWAQPYRVVLKKLKASHWVPVEVTTREMSHAH